MTFGQRVKYYRELKQMSQAKLAKLAGYSSASTISKIESDDRDVPQNTIAALASALGCSPVDLLADAFINEDADRVAADMLYERFKLLSENEQFAVRVMIENLIGEKR